ncbi:hypothetical protein PM035_16425 [Halorubrum ezzemoulense]|uniref:hypothetical protein n=1 Tax=Halorubrum ezzemoulense TaxID=337243 RepID=UPI00232AE64E|nr:hypothetical protein [Halorubrum ezzemoulense]MDB2262450.1 hypothetical protein [Halorubrum ezzemoulense]MDB2269233.1 hypothetical protein [Halorubrum ezzemoulense]
MKVNILIHGWANYHSQSLYYPILVNRGDLAKRNVEVEIHTQINKKITNGDVLILDNRYFREDSPIHSDSNGEKTRSLVSSWSKKVERILWFDNSDAAGLIWPDLLPLVDGYYKNQIFKDKNQYLDPIYSEGEFPLGLHEDYYYRYGHLDTSEAYLKPVLEEPNLLDKLHVSWNIGMKPFHFANKNYEKILNYLPKSIGERFPYESLLRLPKMWHEVGSDRPIDISGRFSLNRRKEAINYHRTSCRDLLPDSTNTDRLPRREYWRELRKAKILISPFGYGTVCLRDFEGFLNGNIIIKPFMDEIKTWPPLYQEGETYIGFEWGLDDLGKVVDECIQNYQSKKKIAENGQKEYKSYMLNGSDTFSKRFVDIIQP